MTGCEIHSDLTRANEVTFGSFCRTPPGIRITGRRLRDEANARADQRAENHGHLGKETLDFEPGTKWQYRNTNYVIAGAIVEKVAGMPSSSFFSRKYSRRSV